MDIPTKECLMWLMTTRGFYSAVQHRDDPTRILVRARCKADIENLHDLLPDSEPYPLVKADYEWRLECSAAEWSKVCAVLALEVDYPNFKNAVARVSGRHASAYHRVWSVLLSLEDHGPWQRKGAADAKPATKAKGKKAAKPKNRRAGAKTQPQLPPADGEGHGWLFDDEVPF